jgi:hypothetical protein
MVNDGWLLRRQRYLQAADLSSSTVAIERQPVVSFRDLLPPAGQARP